jgi:cytochrome b561
MYRGTIMTRTAPVGYSRTQILLHWAIAGLVLVQFFSSDGMEESFDAFLDSAVPVAADLRFANLHAICGLTILVLMLARLYLRLTRGAPALPASEPRLAKFAAHATHGLFYVLLIGMPISGSVAWFLGVEPAGDAHGTAATILLVLIGLHLAGALAQALVFRSNVLTRMTSAED